MAEDHYSLSAKVFHSIREDILNGKYQANEELKEKNIGDDLGVSRTPVREALRQLELEDYAPGGQRSGSRRNSWRNWKKSYFYPIFTIPKKTGIRYWNWITVSTKWYMKHAQAKN